MSDIEDNSDLETVEEVSIVELTQNDISRGLSGLAPTDDGTGIAYTRLYAPGRGAAAVTLLSTFRHLKYVDLSGNPLTDVSPLACAPLRQLTLSCCALTDAALDRLNTTNLVDLDVSGNVRLTTLPHLPSLRSLRACCTDLSALPPLPQATLLDITGTAVAALPSLPSLLTLAAAGAPLADLPPLPQLQHADLRATNFKDSAREAGCWPELRSLDLQNTPLAAAAVAEAGAWAEAAGAWAALPALEEVQEADDEVINEILGRKQFYNQLLALYTAETVLQRLRRAAPKLEKVIIDEEFTEERVPEFTVVGDVYWNSLLALIDARQAAAAAAAAAAAEAEKNAEYDSEEAPYED